MRAVRNTVDTGRTVVCTIHQPSIDIFYAFGGCLPAPFSGQLEPLLCGGCSACPSWAKSCTCYFPRSGAFKSTGLFCMALTHTPHVTPLLSPHPADELLLLKRGGRTIYHGPLGQRSQHLVQYFSVRKYRTLHS